MIVLVWLLVLVILFVATVAFFAGATVYFGGLSNLNTVFTNLGITGTWKTVWESAYSVLTYAYWWVFLIVVIVTLAWAYLWSQRREWESAGGYVPEA